jgi:anti-sigma regulatory factor (Ser/Thr protein kinase)
MRKLEILNSKLKGKSIRLKETTLVGSADDCQIRADHAELHQNHARFFVDEHGKQIVELSDRQGRIYVNGKDVVRAELRNGDTVRVGPLKFRFIDETLASSAVLRLDALMEEYEQTLGTTVYDFATEDLFYLISRNPELRQSISFKIPSKDRFIDQAQAFVSRISKQAGMDEIKHEAFMTCCKELILNAHRHGHNYDETKTIIVRYRDFKDRLALTIEDQGPGFDHRGILGSVTDKDAATAARERYKAGGFGGLGFQLVTKMADELEYNDAGNKVTIKVTKAFD